ncbi:hypothetical protein BOTBODRAFT_49596 [Botryobasidium botryosum FD-172 SS1]|uniref:Uncharacterized protein n=1 Tax=Botryobasidium botryosum (strain FD-172 SS1) TaxID=930990 RepID=A0A067LS13_BOTB1|nr:hypothetical protein BOTBODRAFT_49596 [Botryobasidium botryosum FD-172 SS1]
MAAAPQRRNVRQGDGYLPVLTHQITNNANHIAQVIKFTGGWERWMQIEFARNITNEYHKAVTCEQRIWGGGDRIDLWAESYGDEGVPHAGIELKCRTAKEVGLTFANRFHEDIKQIAKRPAVDNRPCVLYAIALTTVYEDCTTEYVNVIDPATHQPIRINYEEVVQGLYILYAIVTHGA